MRAAYLEVEQLTAVDSGTSAGAADPGPPFLDGKAPPDEGQSETVTKLNSDATAEVDEQTARASILLELVSFDTEFDL